MAVLTDRPPPELEPGVTVDSLATVAECDKALDNLTTSIASIEEQLSRVSKRSPNQPEGWRPSAEKALRVKRMLLPRVQQRRAMLAKADRKSQSTAILEAARLARATKDRAVIEALKEIAPDALAQAGQLARIRHPEIYASAQAAEDQ